MRGETMSLFAIGDTHLSFGTDKPMDVFRGWENYEKKLEKNWKAVVNDNDTVVIPGDITWGMTLQEALEDFRFLDSLPGRKIILKGNHDYWWSTKKKADDFFKSNGIETIDILNNNAYKAGEFALCGSRGWLFENAGEQDEKILRREVGRLKMSVEEAEKLGGEKIAFLHYPPIAGGSVCEEICDVLINGGVTRCFYGHLHGPALSFAFNGEMFGIKFRLVSGDFLNFCPKLIEKF